MSDYIDRTLIKLNRQYGKDELVSSLNKQIKELRFEIGVLKSDVEHEKHRRKEATKKQVELQQRLDKYESKKNIDWYENKVKDLENEISELREKGLISLKNSYEI